MRSMRWSISSLSIKKSSSQRWLTRQHADPFVVKAKKEGYRSRAAFKLIEIDEKTKLFHSVKTVLDLGAAPGGWAQVASQQLGQRGQVIAVDCLPIEPLPGVDIIQGDFEEQAVVEQIIAKLSLQKVEVVMSDMAPNFTGILHVDQIRAIYLAELVFDLLPQVLVKGGNLLIKVFQGEGFDNYFKQLKQVFGKVLVCKPKASRSQSREVYLLARDYKYE